MVSYETNKFMENRDLKEYIVKLNDRNIQRQRESGFTLYAILAGVVYCVFYIIDNIPTAFEIYQEKENLDISIFTADFILIIFNIFLAYHISTRKISVTKIFPFQKQFDIDFKDSILFLFFLILTILNFKGIENHQNTPHLILLLIFLFLTSANLISPFIFKIVRFLKLRKKKKKGHTVEEIDFTYFNYEMTNKLSKGLLITSTVLTIITIYCLLNIESKLPKDIIAKIVKFTLCSFSFLYLIWLGMNIKEKQDDNNLLEDFEREIFFDNLTNEQIIKKYEKDFFGLTFSKWLNSKQIEIFDFFDEKRRLFLAESVRLIEIKKIDKSHQYEYNGRIEEIINRQADVLNKTNDFIQKLNTNFSNLINFSSLNEEEINSLTYIQTLLNQKIINFNHQYNHLSNQLKNLKL